MQYFENNDTSTAGQDLLVLSFGAHPRYQLPCSAIDFLTVWDLKKIPLVSKTLHNLLETNKSLVYTRCRNGKDYPLRFPGYVGLFGNSDNVGGLFEHQLASLQAMERMENTSVRFGGLRGGVLADAPGLGKTITVLALLTQTALTFPVSPPEFYNSQRIQEGWLALTQNPDCASDILQTLKPLRMDAQSCGKEMLAKYIGWERTMVPPFTKYTTFASYKDAVLREWIHPNRVPRVAIWEFYYLMQNLKVRLDKTQRKRRRQTQSDWRIQRALWERRLRPTAATLLVVPDALLEHWYQQIQRHVNLMQLSGNGAERGVVYLDGIGDLAEATVPLSKLQVGPTPSPSQLATYWIVLTTFSRCQRDYRNDDAMEYSRNMTSPFLRLRWLRLIVDEGHELGNASKYEQESDKPDGENKSKRKRVRRNWGVTPFLHQVAAERRWVLSGTPTTGNEDLQQFLSNALDQIQRLLVFLRHPRYGQNAQDEQFHNENAPQVIWQKDVKDPFLIRKSRGRDNLLNVLREVMVLHRKEDIHLPNPIFRQAEVDVPVPAAVQHHLRDVAAHQQLALKTPHQLLDDYLHSVEYQSIVDEAQARYIVDTIQQAKADLQARGGPVTEQQFGTTNDRRPIKAVVYSSSRNNLLSVTEHLYRALDASNIAEMYETHMADLSTELSRFRNGYKNVRQCPLCATPNNLFNPSKANECQKIMLEIVPEDADATSDDSPRWLIEPERIVRALQTGALGIGNVEPWRLDGDPLTKYRQHRPKWRVGDILEVDMRDPHPLLCKRHDEQTWEDWGSARCTELAKAHQYQGRDWFFGPLPSTDNDNNNYLHYVKLVKWQTCGNFHGAHRWYTGPQLKESLIETVKENVFVLSLDANLSHGLDLSFVTHMFLLEPIDDAALLEQVTSRAHRLGATGPVLVDTVNPLFSLDERTRAAMNATETTTSDGRGSSLRRMQQEQKASLSKVVCHYCYRAFESYDKAEEHERTSCPRNPHIFGTKDAFRLSTVYREIRPPPPVDSVGRGS